MTDYAELRKELYEKFHDAYHKLHVLELQEENKRLRAALEQIAYTDPDDVKAWFHNIARDALEGK